MKEFCVDLEIAKELKENGFPQETIENHYVKYTNLTGFAFVQGYSGLLISYPAPTSDELLKELPTCFEKEDNLYLLNIVKDTYAKNHEPSFYCIYYEDGAGRSFNAPNNICVENDKLSNALAEIYILLKKENYL